MVVYIIINLVNGKKYIGKDSKNSKYYMGGGKIIKDAIKKYGKHNFKKEILEYCLDKKTLSEREKHWIEHFNAINSDFFYNILKGGEGGPGFPKGKPNVKWSSDRVNKFKKTMKDFFENTENKKEWEQKHLKGIKKQQKRVISAEHKEKISNALKGNQFRKNKKDTVETIQKRIQQTKGIKKGPQSDETIRKRSISMKEASKTYKTKLFKPILQYDKNNIFVKEWDSISDASLSLDLDIGTLVATLKGRQKTCGGFKWSYKN